MSCDLHCHTRISDGSVGIEELIATAKRRGLSAIAVTDHDAVAGGIRAALIGKRYGITVIPGTEFSAWDSKREQKVHILGYLFDTPDRLEGHCRRIAAARRDAANQMVRKVLRYYPIVPESVARCAAGSTAVYKQHIMHALVDAGYADSFYGDVYRKLFDTKTGSAYVGLDYPDVREVIDLMHSAGGVVVIAHPASYQNEELMAELAAEGRLDGVEVWHPEHSAEDCTRLAAFADEHGLLLTGGTDFHGMYAHEARPLGSCTAPDETVHLLYARKALIHAE